MRAAPCFGVLLAMVSVGSASLGQPGSGGRTARTTTQGEAPQVEHPTAPPAESLVRLTLEQSPSITAPRAGVPSAGEQGESAGALPDPEVGVIYQSAGPPWNPMEPMRMGRLDVSQSIAGFGKRSARRRAAELEGLRESDIRVLRARLGSEARSAYVKVYALDEQRDALDAAKQLAQVLTTGVVAPSCTGQAGESLHDVGGGLCAHGR